jgi:phosphoesterase RecJ-like protein
MGSVLSTARRDEADAFACMRQSLEMQATGTASDEDADGFVNYPLTVGEVEAVAMLKECEPEFIARVLRSKGDVNVAKVAEKFGGGGIETQPAARSEEAGKKPRRRSSVLLRTQ